MLGLAVYCASMAMPLPASAAARTTCPLLAIARVSMSTLPSPSGQVFRRRAQHAAASSRDGADKEVAARFERAIETLRERGATVVAVTVPDLDRLMDIAWQTRMEYDFNAYLAGLGKDRPIGSFEQLVGSGQFIKEVRPFLENESKQTPSEHECCGGG